MIYETDTRQIWYDPDGNGAAARQLIATLQSGATLVATDIVVEGEDTSSGGATEGDDSIVGTAGDDTIDGLGGNDPVISAASQEGRRIDAFSQEWNVAIPARGVTVLTFTVTSG